MRKITFNLISVGFVVVFLLGVAVFTHVRMQTLDGALTDLKSDIREVQQEDEIGDVEGYGLILNGLAYGAGIIGKFLIEVLFVWIPGIFAGVLLLFSVLARVLYRENKERVLIYRILMGIVYGVLFILELLLLGILSIHVSLFAVVLMSGILSVIVLGIRNTYTERIYG